MGTLKRNTEGVWIVDDSTFGVGAHVEVFVGGHWQRGVVDRDGTAVCLGEAGGGDEILLQEGMNLRLVDASAERPIRPDPNRKHKTSSNERRKSRVVTARITVDHKGTRHYEGDPEAIKAAKDDFARMQQREQRRKELWGPIGPASMSRLCNMFPSLRGMPGADPWDAGALLRWSLSGRSHGEVLAAKFVLSVWNHGANWEEVARDEGLLKDSDEHFARFDVFEAIGVWDPEHVAAMRTWLELPFWP